MSGFVGDLSPPQDEALKKVPCVLLHPQYLKVLPTAESCYAWR